MTNSLTIRQQLLLGTAVVATFGMGYGRRSYAGSCTAAPVSVCSGADNVGDVQQNLDAGPAILTVTTTAGFGLTTSGAAKGLDLRGDAISFTDLNASTIRGGDSGLEAVTNAGTGALSITTTGAVTGQSGFGIWAYANGSNITVTTAAVTGAADAMRIKNYGTGILTVTANGSVTGGENGILLRNFGTDIVLTANTGVSGHDGLSAHNQGAAAGSVTVTANGTIDAGKSAIESENRGTGSQTIIARRAITSATEEGITAQNNGTSQTITTAAVTGNFVGIVAQNFGTGSQTITTNGTVSTRSGEGIAATNHGTDLTITTADVIGISRGIFAQNFGTGSQTITTNGTVSTRSGEGIAATNHGTDLTITTADVIGASSGIFAQNSGTGELKLTANGSVSGSTGGGIVALNSGTNLTITTADVSGNPGGIVAQNSGTGDLTIAANGTVSAGTNGRGIDAVNSTAGGDLIVNAKTVIGGSGGGIGATNNGSGQLKITATGPISSTTGAGIASYNSAVGQELTITAGDVRGRVGIHAENSAASTLSITSTGSVVGSAYVGIIAIAQPGSSDVVIKAKNVSGGQAGIFAGHYGDGKVTVTTSGQVLGSGLYGIATRNHSATGMAAQLNIAATSVVSGGVAGIAATANAGQTVFVSNNGVIKNTSGHSTDLAFKADILAATPGPLPNNGHLDISNNNLVTGTVLMGGVSDSFRNSSRGVWNTANGSNDFGGGDDQVLNRGLVVAASRAAVAETTLFDNLETFHNAASGQLRLRDGATRDRAVISGNFNGAGGVVTVDTVLNKGGSASNSDVLVINGNSTGNSRLSVNAVGGAGALTVGNGILVVDVAGSSNGRFTLTNQVSAGAFYYSLNQVDADWYLQSELNGSAAAATIIPQLSEDLGFSFLGTLHERTGEQEHLQHQQTEGGAASGMWSRLIGKVQSETFETSSIGDLKVESRLAGLEVGLDLDRHTDEAGSTSIYGIYGGNAWSNATVNPSAIGANDNQGWLAGLYATHYSVDGWYTDAVVQGSWLDVTAEGDNGHAVSTDATGWLASLEFGLPIAIGNTAGSAFEPQAQLIYSSTHVEDGRACGMVLTPKAT